MRLWRRFPAWPWPPARRGIVYVHGVGTVPFTFAESPDAGLEVHFAPDDGSLARAIALLLSREAYPIRELNLQRGVYISGDNRLLRLEDGAEIPIPES